MIGFCLMDYYSSSYLMPHLRFISGVSLLRGGGYLRWVKGPLHGVLQQAKGLLRLDVSVQASQRSGFVFELSAGHG
jgi:hypothetical protein